MRVFEFKEYKKFVLARIHALPNRGRGQFQKIAEHLRIHSTLVSQILSGERHFTSEQGCELAEYFGLNPLETDFFLNLIEEERAGSRKLKENILRQREILLRRAKSLSSLFPKESNLTYEQQAIYYSHWYYSAIWLLTQVPGFQTADVIAERLQMSQATTRHVIDFLLSVGLLSEKNGKLKSEKNWITASRLSPHVLRHHLNWRQKAFEYLPKMENEELALTGPITLSREDRTKVKKMLEELVSKISKLVESSPPETLMCLNVDFFEPR